MLLDESASRLVQNALVVILLVTLSINAIQVKRWSDGLWYPEASPPEWCRNKNEATPVDKRLPSSAQPAPVDRLDPWSSVGCPISAITRLRDDLASLSVLSELRDRSGELFRPIRERADACRQGPSPKGPNGGGRAKRSKGPAKSSQRKVRRPQFVRTADSARILQSIQRSIDAVDLDMPQLEENVTFATNSVDKLKYQLDNFEPMMHRFSNPQWNDVSLVDQFALRNFARAANTRFVRRKSFLIGISSVNRDQNYLLQTLRSLFHEMSEADVKDVSIVVLNADYPPTKHRDIPLVREEFKLYISTGMLKILELPAAHPELAHPETLTIRWGDPLSRVKWRAKQVLDVAYLMDYAATNPDEHRYFLMMEDDIKAAKRFSRRARDWIDANARLSTDWTMVSFYNPWEGVRNNERLPPYKFFGVIGQVFRIHDLPVVVEFLRKNFDQSPLDWLFVDFLHKFNGTIAVSVPSLFQHQGTVSSFQGKIQNGRSIDFEYEVNYQIPDI